MKAILDENCVLHILPCNSTETIALKYWVKEFNTHGVKMLEVADSVSDGKDLLLEHSGDYKRLPMP